MLVMNFCPHVMRAADAGYNEEPFNELEKTACFSLVPGSMGAPCRRQSDTKSDLADHVNKLNGQRRPP